MTANPFLLPIPASDWPPPREGITVDGIELVPKSELHVTLVGSALARELRATFGDAFLDTMLAGLREPLDWRFRRSGLHLLLRRPYGAGQARVIAHSLIEPVILPAMAQLHHRLGRALGRQLPVPPPHVTLYTAGRARGIGVSSAARLRAFTVRRVQRLPPP